MLHIKSWLVDEYYYRFCTNGESYDHDKSQAKNLSLQLLPYSLIISLCFSAIVSLVYAKSIKNHVVEIKSVTDQMMALDKKARLETDSSYEIGQLKAQINDLYETHFLIRFPILNLKIKRF